MRIALVSCGSAKLDCSAPARELYTSNLFRLAARYAERHFDRWYVLSARHGLVAPEAVLAPYDLSLAQLDNPARTRWALDIATRLRRAFPGADFTLLAGGPYRGLLRHMDAAEPLAGLTIGRRLAWLKAAA